MDLENNQDFDLEDILKEFGDHPEPEAPALPEEPEQALPEQMPELRFDAEPEETSVTGELPDTEPEEASFAEELPDMVISVEPDLDFQSVLSDETQTFVPVAQEDELSFDDAVFSEFTEDTVDLTEEAAPQSCQPPVAEPAFEVEEEFIPSPIVFTPRSRLDDLEKRRLSAP